MHAGDPAFAAGVSRSIRSWTDAEIASALESFLRLGYGDTETYRVIDREQALRAEIRLCRGFEGRCVSCGLKAPGADHRAGCTPSYEPANDDKNAESVRAALEQDRQLGAVAVARGADLERTCRLCGDGRAVLRDGQCENARACDRRAIVARARDRE